MRNITVSLYSGAKSNQPETRELTWPQLVHVLTQHKPRDTKGGKALGFYRLRDNTTRSNANVELVHAIALDFDRCIAYSDIAESVAAYAHVFHTSYSHTKQCPKGRLVMPLSRPVTTDEFKSVWLGAYRLTGELGDEQASDASRIFYLPRCPEERLDDAESYHVEGNWIDTEYLIELGRDLRPARINATNIDPFGMARPFDVARVRHALSKLDWDSYKSWLMAGMALHSTGREDAYALWTEFSQLSTKYNERAQHDAWNHFTHNRDAEITLGTLFHEAGMQNVANIGSQPARSELGLAERFVQQHGGRVKYVTDEGVYLVWNGQVWQRDPDERAMMQLMIDTVKSIPRNEVTALMGKNDDEAKRAAMWAINNAQKRVTMSEALRLAKVNSAIATEARALDAGLHLLQVENGIVHLGNGRFSPSAPEALHTCSSRATFIEDAPCSTWLKFLDEVTAGDQAMQSYLQRAVGYSLSGHNDAQCFFFLYGLGANGKSVFLNLLRELAGSYHTTANADTFMLQQRSASGASPDMAALAKCRLVCVTELPQGQRLDEARIKSLTGGEELSARQLYKGQFTFAPRFKLWLAGNHRPTVKGNDHGIWRRIHLIPFTVQIPPERQDPNLIAKLKAELPGILAWAIVGYQAYKAEGLNPPKAVRDGVESYKSDEDVLGDWLAACGQYNDQATASRDELYASYLAHCNRVSTKPVSRKAMYESLRGRGLNDAKAGGVRVIRGIKLKGIPDFMPLTV